MAENTQMVGTEAGDSHLGLRQMGEGQRRSLEAAEENGHGATRAASMGAPTGATTRVPVAESCQQWNICRCPGQSLSHGSQTPHGHPDQGAHHLPGPQHNNDSASACLAEGEAVSKAVGRAGHGLLSYCFSPLVQAEQLWQLRAGVFR